MLWAWRTEADVMWAPAGLGRHLDHWIVAQAAADLVHAGVGGIGFYEDRPYCASLDDDETADQLAELGFEFEAHDVS